MWHMTDWKYAENLIHHVMHDSFLWERLSLKSMYSSQLELSFKFLIMDISLLFSFHLVNYHDHIKKISHIQDWLTFLRKTRQYVSFVNKPFDFTFSISIFLNHFVILILCLSFVIFPRMKGLLCKRGPNNLNRDKLPLIQHKMIRELCLNSL